MTHISTSTVSQPKQPRITSYMPSPVIGTAPSFTQRLQNIGRVEEDRVFPSCFIDFTFHDLINEPVMIDHNPHHVMDAKHLEDMKKQDNDSHVNFCRTYNVKDSNLLETTARIKHLEISLLILTNAKASAESIATHQEHLTDLKKSLFKYEYPILLKKHLQRFVERIEKIYAIKDQIEEFEYQYDLEEQEDNEYSVEKIALLLELKDLLDNHVRETEKTIDTFAIHLETSCVDIHRDKFQSLKIEQQLLKKTEEEIDRVKLREIQKTNPEQTLPSSMFSFFGQTNIKKTVGIVGVAALVTGVFVAANRS